MKRVWLITTHMADLQLFVNITCTHCCISQWVKINTVKNTNNSTVINHQDKLEKKETSSTIMSIISVTRHSLKISRSKLYE